jgi:hypothetical protein
MTSPIPLHEDRGDDSTHHPIYGRNYEELLDEEVMHKYSSSFRVIVVASVAMIALGFALITNPQLVGNTRGFTTKPEELSSSSQGKPNIIFLLIDDMGYNSIDKAIMPFTSELISAGIAMSNYYTQEACTPARASLMTGRYPINIGWQYDVVNIDQDEGLGLNQTTFVELLKDNG